MKKITHGCSRLYRSRVWRQSITALMLGLCLSPLIGRTQDATWIGQTSDWNTGTNWRATLPTPVPTVPTGTATFSTQGVQSLTFSQGTSIGALQFNSPNYVFNLNTFLPDTPVTITGIGVGVSASANAPIFNVLGGQNLIFESGTAGPAVINITNLYNTIFHGTSTAGNATITAGKATDTTGGFEGGFLKFFDNSTAGNATITTFVGSNAEFRDSSTAGKATITDSADGFTFFQDQSNAENAMIIIEKGGNTDFSLTFEAAGNNPDFNGGTSTAGNATIVNAGLLRFFDGSQGGNATITTNSGGLTQFFDKSTGGNAAFITAAGGLVDISGLISTGMTAGSIAGAGTYRLGSKELTVGSNNSSTDVSGLVEGNGGSLVKVGTGTLTLLGDNTYSGGTTIREGVLVAGTPNATQTISNALGTGNVFLNGGTLRTPSLDPLIINVGGNYTQRSGGTLALGVAGVNGAQYDHVQVGKNATMGGILAVSSLNNFRPVSGNGFEVLHTNGVRSGEFAQVNDSLNNNPNLQRIDIYAPNGVALVYVAAPAPSPQPTPAPPGPQPTPTPRPPIVEVIPEPLPPVDPNEPLPPAEEIRLIDPTVEQFTALFEISFSGANTQRFSLDERLAEIQMGSTGFSSNLNVDKPPTPYEGKNSVIDEKSGKGAVENQPVLQPTPQNRWGVWVTGWGDFVNVGDDNFAKGYDFTTGGVTLGIDYRITNHLAIGLFGSYAHTWTDLQPGHIDVNTGRVGLYATYFDRGFYVNSAVFGGYNSYDTNRQGLLGSATGSTDGEEFSTYIGAGYNFHFGKFAIGPTAALQYTYVNVNSFNEQGSLVPLQIHSDSQDSLRTDLGFRASYTWHAGRVSIIPSLTAAWEHEYLYSALPITVSSPEFPGPSTTFSGPNEGHDSAIVNAGVGTQWTPTFSTYIGYQGQLGRDLYNSNAVTGNISFSF